MFWDNILFWSYSGVRIKAKISAKNCEIWLKIDEIWPNSASQKIRYPLYQRLLVSTNKKATFIYSKHYQIISLRSYIFYFIPVCPNIYFLHHYFFSFYAYPPFSQNLPVVYKHRLFKNNDAVF